MYRQYLEVTTEVFRKFPVTRDSRTISRIVNWTPRVIYFVVNEVRRFGTGAEAVPEGTTNVQPFRLLGVKMSSAVAVHGGLVLSLDVGEASSGNLVSVRH